MSNEDFEKQFKLPVFAPEFYRKVNTLARVQDVYFYRPAGAVKGRPERFAITLWGIIWKEGRFVANCGSQEWPIVSNSDFVVVLDGKEIPVDELTCGDQD